MRARTDAASPAPADAIELTVFRHLFAAVAEEMGLRLMRSAFSPNIKERRDFSCAVFDAAGALLAQAAHIPVHLGSMAFAVRAVLEAFPDAVFRPCVHYVHNDPFCGGTHLPDITVVAPCMAPGEEQARFFVASRAHHTDVGGLSPGSMPLSTSIDEEGLLIRPMVLDSDAATWIASHSRTPDERRGDLLAQVAAVDAGATRLAEMCSRYGAGVVVQRGRELCDYTERTVRRVIGTIADGEYRFEDVLDDDGLGTHDIRLACRQVISGDSAVVDFRGCADQVRGPVNAVRAVTIAAVSYVLSCLIEGEAPPNSGLLRPVRVLTRPGSVVDALPPAAVAAGNVETSQRIVDVLLGALAQALPGRIPAASQGTMNNVAIGGNDVRNPARPQAFAYYETLGGGAGGGPSRSGADALHTHMTNTLNTPVEALEHTYPLRVEEYSIRRNSGGGGAQPGGCGIVRRLAALAPVEATLLTERRVHPPYGLRGGAPGAPGRNTLITAQGERRELPGKCRLTLQPGEALEIATPGGGGWGSPTQQEGLKDADGRAGQGA